MNKVINILLSIGVALFVLSAGIACPILIRGFYYGEIDRLGIVQDTGYDKEVIIEAYDQMMDYCTGGGEKAGLTFGTGELAWSQSGKAHFDDVEGLFRLDINVLKVTAAIAVLAIILRVAGRRAYKHSGSGDLAGETIGDRAGTGTGARAKAAGRQAAPADTGTGARAKAAGGQAAPAGTWLDDRIALNRGPLFWGPAGLACGIAAITLAAATDFDRFFVTFHHIFFPGKENWIFDPNQDEIIRILPEEFFRDCAILIVIAVIILSAVMIAIDILTGKKRHD